MSNGKSSIILLGVVALALIGAGFFWLAVGPQLIGLLLLVLGVISFIWLWRTWRHMSKA